MKPPYTETVLCLGRPDPSSRPQEEVPGSNSDRMYPSDEDVHGMRYRANVTPEVTTEFDTENDGDVFECLEKGTLAPDEPTSTLCELHTYDSRYNTKGERVYLQSGRKRDWHPDPPQRNEAALVLVRHYNAEKILDETTLEIRSPHVKDALKEVIVSYPGINLHSSSHITLNNEPQCLFHYRKELQAYAVAKGVDQPEAKNHVLFCLRYAYTTLKRQCWSYKSTMSGNGTYPGLEFDHLWMAFKPGDYIYHRNDQVEIAFRLIKIEKLSLLVFQTWTLVLEHIKCDGKDFGHARENVHISRYDGYRPLVELEYCPIRFHPERERIKRYLTSRGRAYVSLFGSHHRLYQGMADFLEEREISRDDLDSDDEYEHERRRVKRMKRVRVERKEVGLSLAAFVSALDPDLR